MVIVALGIMRSKRNESITAVAPDQGQPNRGVYGQGAITPPSGAETPHMSGSVTVTGQTYQTPYGRVSVSITVNNGKITGVTMPQFPNSSPSIYAEPYLIQQALAAGSANIQGVSGATYTSIAFKSSLESAIAQANTQGQSITPVAAGTSAATIPASKPVVPSRYRDDD